MKEIKIIECSCGEDVYENDYSRKVNGIQYLVCGNCSKEYPESALKEVEVPTINVC